MDPRQPPDWLDELPHASEAELGDPTSSNPVPGPSNGPSPDGESGTGWFFEEQEQAPPKPTPQPTLQVVAGEDEKPKTPAERTIAGLKAKNKPHADGWRIGGSSLDGLERLRTLPALPIPPRWPDLARRVQVYPGEILTVVAPTGAGKTSWALAVAMEFAAATKGVVTWLPRELDALQLDMRIVAQVMGMPWREVRTQVDPDVARRAHPMKDRLAYAPRVADLGEQISALAWGLDFARKSAGGARPLLVVDTVQLMASAARERRGGVAEAIEQLRALTLTADCYTILVSASSRAGQTALRGSIDYDDARDAVGLGAETSELENASAAVIGLQVMPRDPDTGCNDAIALLAKLRNGEDGERVGMRYDGRRGGRWTELDYIPETKAQSEKTLAKLRKHNPEATKEDAQRAGRETQQRRSWDRKWQLVCEALRREGTLTLGAMEKVGLGNRGVLRRMLEQKREIGEVEYDSAGKKWFLPNGQGRLM